MIRIRHPRFKSMVTRPGLLVVLACSVLTVSACDRTGKSDWRPAAAANPAVGEASEAGYVAPPAVDGAQRTGSGLTLGGSGAPGAAVRLGAPTGEVLLGRADATGRWTLTVPASDRVRLYGLSMTLAGRTVQAEGYVLVTPEARLALLRAGAGTWVMGQESVSPRILAVDVDPQGGAVISGIGSPGAGLGARIDRTTRAVGQADDAGRFFLSLREPLGPGDHDIQVSGEGGEQRITLAVSPAAPLNEGPVRATRTESGWRIDWITPGGGMQTTYLLSGQAR
jgi:hypothetical protein